MLLQFHAACKLCTYYVGLAQTTASEVSNERDKYQFIHGRDGAPGRDGRDGVIGPQGPPGFPGFPGHKGEQGEQGKNGPTGHKGERGTRGPTGTTGMQGPQGDTGSRGRPGEKGSPSSTPFGSVIYTRWGKRTCRPGAYLVYAGRAGTSFHSHKGGGSNYLCMPNDPEYTLAYKSGVQGHSYMYGVEYEATAGVNRNNHNAQCAVCLVSNKEVSLMIPAKTSCPSGWTREYYGYLMAENTNNPRTEYVCVDSAMDAVPGSQNHINSGHFWHVEGHCDGVPCPPYINYKELNCVVCTK